MKKLQRYRKIAYTSQPLRFMFTFDGYEFSEGDTVSVDLYTDPSAKKTVEGVITGFNVFDAVPDLTTPFAPGIIYADITITSADGTLTVHNGVGTEVTLTLAQSAITPTREVRFAVPVESYDVEGSASGEA